MLNHSSRLPQSTPLTVCAIMGFEEVPTLTLHPHAPKFKITKKYWYWTFYPFNVSSIGKTLKFVGRRSAFLNSFKKEIVICLR